MWKVENTAPQGLQLLDPLEVTALQTAPQGLQLLDPLEVKALQDLQALLILFEN